MVHRLIPDISGHVSTGLCKGLVSCDETRRIPCIGIPCISNMQWLRRMK